MPHHPTWSEIRDLFTSDPEVAAAAEELYHVLIEDDALYARLREDTYEPVTRDRATERSRCEATIPGYAEARARSSLREHSNASNGEAFGVAE